MNLELMIVLFFGGGGAVGFMSAYFTRKSSKEKTEIDLLDRAYKEIERLDEQLIAVKAELLLEKNDNERLKELIKSIEEQVIKQKNIIKQLKGEM